MTVSETDEINLDGSFSFDPDEDDSSTENYLWQCFNSKQQPLTDKSGQERLKLPPTASVKFKVEGIMKPGQM